MSYGYGHNVVDLPKCCDCFVTQAADCVDTILLHISDYSNTDVIVELATALGNKLRQSQQIDANGDLTIDVSIWRKFINRYGSPYTLKVYFSDLSDTLWIETQHALHQCILLYLVPINGYVGENRISLNVNECDCRPCGRYVPETMNLPHEPCVIYVPVECPPETDCTIFEYTIDVLGVTPYPAFADEVKAFLFSGTDSSGIILVGTGELIPPYNTVNGVINAFASILDSFFIPTLPSTTYTTTSTSITVRINIQDFLDLHGVNICDNGLYFVSRDENDPDYPDSVQAIVTSVPCCPSYCPEPEIECTRENTISSATLAAPGIVSLLSNPPSFPSISNIAIQVLATDCCNWDGVLDLADITYPNSPQANLVWEAVLINANVFVMRFTTNGPLTPAVYSIPVSVSLGECRSLVFVPVTIS